MHKLRLAALGASLALTLLAAPAGAQEEGDTTDAAVSGQVVWSFDDTALSYVTSSAVYDTIRIGSGAVVPVNPDDKSPEAKKLLTVMATETIEGGGALSISVEFVTDPAKDGVVGRVDFTPDPEQSTLWVNGAAGAAPITVTIDSYSFDGATGKVSGSFTGALCNAADWEAPPDSTDCTAVSGRFDTELYAGL